MTTKICRTCHVEQPITNFHQHPTAADRHSGVCKTCSIEYVREWRLKHPEYKERANKRNTEYYQTQRGKESHYSCVKTNRQKHPQKYQAWCKLRNALSRGKIVKPSQCDQCGSTTSARNLHGHHADYSQPLSVLWLCYKCHKQIHDS